jgi:hypothetical protein
VSVEARDERRRHLAADVAAADHHHPLRLGHVLPDGVGVAKGTQVMDVPSGPVLDAGCGTDRHTACLRRRVAR